MKTVTQLADVATRAETALRLAAQRNVIYKLGCGGFDPDAPTPWSFAATLDCSGFAAWCMGLPRHYPPMPDGDWIETSQIYRDATRKQVIFEKLDAPEVGALLVWPDRVIDRAVRQGHVGVVVALDSDADGPNVARVIHCSSGNYRATGSAIAATSADVFGRNGAIVARLKVLA